MNVGIVLFQEVDRGLQYDWMLRMDFVLIRTVARLFYMLRQAPSSRRVEMMNVILFALVSRILCSAWENAAIDFPALEQKKSRICGQKNTMCSLVRYRTELVRSLT